MKYLPVVIFLVECYRLVGLSKVILDVPARIECPGPRTGVSGPSHTSLGLINPDYRAGFITRLNLKQCIPIAARK